MTIHIYNIGDSVVIKPTREKGKITDTMYSDKRSKYIYEVTTEEGNQMLLQEEEMEAAPETLTKYEYTLTVADNVVIAVLYEVDGDSWKEVARGHGHVIHEGILGIAQAGSYALKRLYWNVAEDENEDHL